MIHLKAEGNIIYAEAKNKLTDEDYDRFIPFTQKEIEKQDTVRLYFEMKDFEGWELTALWRDAKFDFKNANNFEKVAMVGSKDWEDWLTKLMKPFTKATVKFFDASDREVAKKWVES